MKTTTSDFQQAVQACPYREARKRTGFQIVLGDIHVCTHPQASREDFVHCEPSKLMGQQD